MSEEVQEKVPIVVVENSTHKRVEVGDDANKAVRVNMVAGSLAVTATTTGKATAAAPTYVEGTDNPLSLDLSGSIRTLATITGASSFSDGAVDRQARVQDTDTGGGTHYTAEAMLVTPGAGGPTQTGTAGSPLRIDPTGGTTQPVSAASLPLPTGASTEATLALIKAKTDNLDVVLSTRTKPADTQKVDGSAVTQPVSGTFWQATQPVSGSVSVSNFPATQPVSAVALPLPAGASTSALQTTGNASLASIDGKLTNPLPVSGAVTAAKATAAAPSYVEASNNPLSVDLGGNLRVVSVGGTTTFTAIEDSAYNGSDLTLTLAHTPTGEPLIIIGGVLWYLGTNYSRVGAVITWITFPVLGELIEVRYPWAMASATMNATLVVDLLGNIQPTGDTSARPIHVVDDVLALSQGAVMAGAKGPMVQGIVSDTVQQFFNDVIQPLQLTADGRLRVQTSSESNNFTAWGDPLDIGEGASMAAFVSWG